MTSLSACTAIPSDLSFGDGSLMKDINLRTFCDAIAYSAGIQLAGGSLKKLPTSAPTARPVHQTTELESLSWVRELKAGNDYTDLQIIEKLYKETGVVGPDHIFRALARHGMVRDNKAFFRAGSPLAPVVAASSPEEASDATQMHILNVYALGDEIAGHEGLVHGGLSAALIDETFGYLLYAAKAAGILEFEMVMTAQLNVTYLRPLPTKSIVTCTSSIASMEGRKIWVEATLSDCPGSEMVFAKAKALFIIPKAN